MAWDDCPVSNRRSRFLFIHHLLEDIDIDFFRRAFSCFKGQLGRDACGFAGLVLADHHSHAAKALAVSIEQAPREDAGAGASHNAEVSFVNRGGFSESFMDWRNGLVVHRFAVSASGAFPVGEWRQGSPLRRPTWPRLMARG